MKFCVSLIKSFFLSIFILYLFNVMSAPIDCYIQINIITVSLVMILGFPGLITLVIFMFFIL